MPTFPPVQSSLMSQALAPFERLAGISCPSAAALPHVTVLSTSRDIAYDFRHGQDFLGRQGADYQSPYPPDADVVTRGLRADRPEFKLEATWHDLSYPLQQRDCLSVATVTLTIRLQPRIFIAREVAPGLCQDTILAHERHHVDIDREELAKYTPLIRQAVERNADAVGVIGPLPHDAVSRATAAEIDDLGKTVATVQRQLSEELDARQQAFDSLQEYTRVSAICRRADAEGR